MSIIKYRVIINVSNIVGGCALYLGRVAGLSNDIWWGARRRKTVGRVHLS
jgi:hypothetical protein